MVTQFVWGSPILPASTKRFVVTCTLPSSSTPSFLPLFYLPYSFSPPLPIPPLLPLTSSTSLPPSTTLSVLPFPYSFPSSSLLLYDRFLSLLLVAFFSATYLLPSLPSFPSLPFYPSLTLHSSPTPFFLYSSLLSPLLSDYPTTFLLPFTAPEPQTFSHALISSHFPSPLLPRSFSLGKGGGMDRGKKRGGEKGNGRGEGNGGEGVRAGDD